MKLYKALIILSLLILSSSWSVQQERPSLLDTNPPFHQYLYSQWVDSLINTMTLNEKIGQLFMVAAYSNRKKEHEDKIVKLIKNQKIGGLIFFQGTPEKQIDLTNRYQSVSKVPLLIAGDWEWGLSMRLKNTVRFPRQMMLGAIQNDSLIYEMGAEIARQIKAVGGHINFAPVVDINNNPKNPVIGSRSFGEQRERVTELSYMYMKGLQDNRVLAVAKHFPGHGDTDTDSHKDLPIILHPRTRLDSVELYPFKQLFNEGLGGVMVAHLFVPVLDSTKNTATTLSRKVSWELLKEQMNFKGLAFTDALNMKGVSKFFKPGEADLKALLAGNDVLLFPKDVPKAVAMIKKAIKDKRLSLEELEGHLRKILALKQWSGAYKYQTVSKESISKQLDNDDVVSLRDKLINNAITLVYNDNTLPIQNLEGLKIASVAIGESQENAFQKSLALYTDVKAFQIKKYPTQADWNALEKKLKGYDLTIFSFHKTNRRPSKNYGISLASMKFVEKFARKHPTVLNCFANPYALSKFKDIQNFKALVVSYNDWEATQKISAQKIFGATAFSGHLPVGINAQFPAGTGVSEESLGRLQYTTPADAGVDKAYLYKIDSIVLNSIQEKAFPGCQILAARNGKVFYHKAFGHHTFKGKQSVALSDLYDLASLTKILSTTASLMKLTDEDKFNVDNTLGDYLPMLKGSNKASLRIKDVLTHQARLKPWIPFFMATIETDSIKQILYRNKKQGKWSVQVADNLYIDSTYRDTIYQIIKDTDLRKKEGYRYSDLGFYLMQKIVEQKVDAPINDFVESTFYSSLGANYLGYLPLNKYSKTQIVPTEDDDYYRHQLVDGYVHDMGAAMLGGVGGHAGLFSNANDVAKMMQMFLQKGHYANKQYIDSSTIDEFTACPFCPDNRRGIAFDKPEMTNDLGPTCELASASSFGHTGFTGTMAWVDPENGLLYIFLSNRIHPKSDNIKIIKLNTRTEIQKVLYESLL